MERIVGWWEDNQITIFLSVEVITEFLYARKKESLSQEKDERIIGAMSFNRWEWMTSTHV